jgi:hypothetical protein
MFNSCFFAVVNSLEQVNLQNLPLPDLVELSLNPENQFSGTNASNLIAGRSLTFVGHWKQGSSSVLPSGAGTGEQLDIQKSAKRPFLKLTQQFLENQDL